MNRPATAVAAAALCLFAGCSILSPQPDRSRFYVLTASVDQSAPPDATSGLALGFGPVKFPDYLDRSQMVTRVAPNQVVYSDVHRWAEPLDRNFSRVMNENLTRLLNTDRIVSLPTFVPVAVQFDIPMEILRFESDDQGVVELAARWAIRSGNGKLLYATESHITETASGTKKKEIVAALSRAVGKLSEELAGEIRRLSSTQREPEASDRR
jgi:uncharacterized lipoprotein YmbA